MEQPDFTRFRAVLAGMAELYQRELTPALLDAYWLALRDWTLAEFQQAAGHLMAQATFMPRPSEFNALRQAARPTAGEAWQAVLANVRRSQYRSGVTVGGAADRAVAALGGYAAVGMCTDDRLSYMERRFADHFEAVQSVEDTRAAVPELARPTECLPASRLARLGLDS